MIKHIKLSLLSLLVVLALAVGYLAATTKLAQAPEPETQQQASSETAGWKTNRNEALVFELKHPQDWQAAAANNFVRFTRPYLGTEQYEVEISVRDEQSYLARNKNEFVAQGETRTVTV